MRHFHSGPQPRGVLEREYCDQDDLEQVEMPAVALMQTRHRLGDQRGGVEQDQDDEEGVADFACAGLAAPVEHLEDALAPRRWPTVAPRCPRLDHPALLILASAQSD